LTSNLLLWGEKVFNKSQKEKKGKRRHEDIHFCISLKVNKQLNHQGMVLLNDITSILCYINIITNSLKVSDLDSRLIIFKTKNYDLLKFSPVSGQKRN